MLDSSEYPIVLGARGRMGNASPRIAAAISRRTALSLYRVPVND